MPGVFVARKGVSGFRFSDLIQWIPLRQAKPRQKNKQVCFARFAHFAEDELPAEGGAGKMQTSLLFALGLHYLCPHGDQTRYFQMQLAAICRRFRHTLPDIAFIGRSNVGKSSLINLLTGHGSLAKVSGTPGKTRLINHFLIDDRWYLVDLPGYGYAASRRANGANSRNSSPTTCSGRRSALPSCWSTHLRLEPQAIDLRFIRLLGEHGIPFGIVFTKTTSSPQPARRAVPPAIKKQLLTEQWEELPPIFFLRAPNARGAREILAFIDKCLRILKKSGNRLPPFRRMLIFCTVKSLQTVMAIHKIVSLPAAVPATWQRKS